jgi:hypothetical protein
MKIAYCKSEANTFYQEVKERTDIDRGKVRTMSVPNIEQPSFVGVEIATRKLRNGMTTGNDQFPADLIEVFRRQRKNFIYEFTLQIWQ